MSKAITHNSLEWHVTRAHSRDLTVSIIVSSSSIYSNFWSAGKPLRRMNLLRWVGDSCGELLHTRHARVWDDGGDNEKFSRSMTTDNNFWHLIKSAVKVTKEEENYCKTSSSSSSSFDVGRDGDKVFRWQFAQPAGDWMALIPWKASQPVKIDFPRRRQQSHQNSRTCSLIYASKRFCSAICYPSPEKPVPLTPTDAEIHQLNRHWVAV